VFWSLGELCCRVHNLLAGSPKPERSNVNGQMIPHVAGGDKHEANNLAYKTTCINKHNDCCHMENFEVVKKRVIRTMSCILLLGMC
jgi:hypothetical protein